MRTQDKNLEQAIIAVLNTQPCIGLAILFGSLASGKENRESDLDLAIDAGHYLTPDEKMTLITLLTEKIGRPVDLVDIRTTGEPVLGQILRYGKRILESDNNYAELLYRHLLEQADFLPYRNRILQERRAAWIGK